ncbi:hypothetical protein SMU89_09861, partial [Streptococcus mutans NLML1]
FRIFCSILKINCYTKDVGCAARQKTKNGKGVLII